ncbi:MAG: hypothetical protein KKF12_03525 [Proteobacteria bacterium]|nr:hypothetical protein [Pseudomonadota bacterium]
MIQDMVWIDFSVSDLKLQYMGWPEINHRKPAVNLIGDKKSHTICGVA